MPQKIVPDITKINVERIDEVSPHYVWIDEDKRQVSQVCSNFRVAMQFVLNWQERWDKLNSKTGMRYAGETESDKFSYEHSPWRKLTRSGKPPKELKRIEVEINLVDPTEEEQFKAKVLLGDVMHES